MMIELTFEERRKVNLFLEKYKDEYPKHAIEYLYNVFSDGMIDIRMDIVRQVLAALGILSDEMNIYKAYLLYLEKIFSLKRDIVEVGSGFYPILSSYIDKKQNILEAGTITSYDPRLIISNLGNVCLIKDPISEENFLKQFDLAIAFAPCEATEILIRNANRDKIEFSIALCGCTHFPDNMLGIAVSRKLWENYIYDIAKRTKSDDGELMIDYFDSKYDYPYPVITKKFKRR